MTDDHLIAVLSRADLYGPDSEMPAEAWGRGHTLTVIERRMGMDPRTDVEERTEHTDRYVAPEGDPQAVRRAARPTRSLRGPLVAAALAAVVLVLGVGSWLLNNEPDDAAATGSGFVEAFNDGDVNRLLGLLAPDATVSWMYTTMSPDFEPLDRESFDRQMVWELAQGSIIRSDGCVLSPEQSSVVTCAVEWYSADFQAVEGRYSQSTITMSIENGQVTDLMVEQFPNFSLASFEAWVAENHPESAEFIEFREWTSIEDARAGGERRAELASEWKAFLDANCTVETVDGVFARVVCP